MKLNNAFVIVAVGAALTRAGAILAADTNATKSAEQILAEEARKQVQAGGAYNSSATVAFDYYHYDLDLRPGGQTGYSQAFGSGTLRGDLYGTTLAYGYKRLYFDGAYRQGTLKGDVSYGNASAHDDADRHDFEAGLSYRQGSGLFKIKPLGWWVGASYNYIGTDYRETLPPGSIWSATGTPSREYSDVFHNFMAKLGLQYTISLLERENTTIRLIPKALGGVGIGHYGQDSTRSGVDTELWQGNYLAQGTGQLEFTFHQRHTFFLEGGYKRIGYWQSKSSNLSSAFHGPYARVGYSLAW